MRAKLGRQALTAAAAAAGAVAGYGPSKLLLLLLLWLLLEGSVIVARVEESTEGTSKPVCKHREGKQRDVGGGKCLI